MVYGVFQVENNVLVFRTQFNSESEAIAFAKTGSWMLVLPIYI